MGPRAPFRRPSENGVRHTFKLFTDIVDFRIDPIWHAFESVAYTDAAADAGISLAGFTGKVYKP